MDDLQKLLAFGDLGNLFDSQGGGDDGLLVRVHGDDDGGAELTADLDGHFDGGIHRLGFVPGGPLGLEAAAKPRRSQSSSTIWGAKGLSRSSSWRISPLEQPLALRVFTRLIMAAMAVFIFRSSISRVTFLIVL